MESDKSDYFAKVPVYSKKDKVPFLLLQQEAHEIFMYF